MGASGGFPIDLILFGMIAAFLVLRLKGILGKRTGYERPSQATQSRRVPAAVVQPLEPAPAHTVSGTQRVVPEPVSDLGRTLTRMTTIDRNFSPTAFLGRAEKAFQIVVHAFAAGDRATLRPLLGDDAWKAFDLAISKREKAGYTHVTDVRAIHGVKIEAAELRGTLASITIRVVSDQVNMTHTQSGQVMNGTDAVTEITDLWTLERDLGQIDPIWHLVAARSA